jgi:hypothetical protein
MSILELYEKCKKIDPNTGFIITRSLNKNIVNYQLNDQDDNLSIHPYWLMYEKKNQNGTIPKEELTFLERKTAYEIDYKYQTLNSCEFYLKSYPDIQLKANKTKQSIEIKLQDEYYHLIGLFIHFNTYNILKPVSQVDIYYIRDSELKLKKIIK